MKLHHVVFLALFASVLFLGCASMIPTSTGTTEQEEPLGSVSEFPDKAKDELFDLAMQWVARTYNSANDVVQLKDKGKGQIICRGIGSAPMDFGFQRNFRYTMIIDVKDGKLRTRFENITSEKIGDMAGPNMAMQWEYVASYFKLLNANLFAAISGGDSEENW